jgi:hypothetical protein
MVQRRLSGLIERVFRLQLSSSSIVIVIIVVKLYRRIRSNQLIAAISRYFLSGNGAFQSNKNQH